MTVDLDTAPKFPTETFEAVIDQVYSLQEKDFDVDKLLGVFSLVSKSWLPRSRHHLFQRLTIRGDTWTMTKRFLDLLDSPLCSVKPYVRILELDERKPMWSMDALPRLSVLLPEVQELWIREGKFDFHPKVLSTFVDLQILVLDDCYFDSSAHLFEMLSMCTSLQKIDIIELCIIPRSDSSSAVVNGRPPTSLRSIRIQSSAINTIHSGDMMEWLMSGEQVPAIETLDLSVTQEDDTKAIGPGLRRLGACLKNLEVQFTFDRSIQNAFLRDVDLGCNTNLNSICLRLGPASVASLLAHVTSFEVREVVVDFREGYDQMLNEVDWDAVARILDQPKFSKLERLIICVRRDVDGVRRSMMQRLPLGRACSS